VAVERAKRVEVLENDGGRMNSMGLHGEGWSVPERGGIRRWSESVVSSKKGNAGKKREGRYWEQLWKKRTMKASAHATRSY
jgi:hypothetical protein